MLIRALRVRPRAFGLGIQSKGKDARAIELHAEQKAMAEALGDRAGVETACCNLGKCYAHTGEYARAIELHAEHKEMAEELGDRAEVEAACGNLGNSPALSRRSRADPPPRPSNSAVARTSTTTVQPSGSHAPRPPQ